MQFHQTCVPSTPIANPSIRTTLSTSNSVSQSLTSVESHILNIRNNKTVSSYVYLTYKQNSRPISLTTALSALFRFHLNAISWIKLLLHTTRQPMIFTQLCCHGIGDSCTKITKISFVVIHRISYMPRQHNCRFTSPVNKRLYPNLSYHMYIGNQLYISTLYNSNNTS